MVMPSQIERDSLEDGVNQLGKKKLKMIKKQKKRSMQLAARDRKSKSMEHLKVIPIPNNVKVMKRKYTDSEIVDLMNMNYGPDYLALDCEFVTSLSGNSLGSVAIVDFNADKLFFSYSKPDTAILDYKTPWSGIRKRDLVDAPSFKVVRESVLSIIKNKVVIGHAVYNDFKVLQIDHPNHLIIDTCSLPWLRSMALSVNERGRSLKRLAYSLLDLDIQCGEHCPLEDAKTTMLLFHLVKHDWIFYLEYKHKAYLNSLLNHIDWKQV